MKSVFSSGHTGLAAAACSVLLLGSSRFAQAADAKFRTVMYYDSDHRSQGESIPDDVKQAITHVIVTFARPDELIKGPGAPYSEYESAQKVRDVLGNQDMEVGCSVGGWTYSTYFDNIQENEMTLDNFTTNLNTMGESFGCDFYDIDWEYVGGWGDDYKQEDKTNDSEVKKNAIVKFPLILQEVKKKIGSKYISLAVGAKDEYEVVFKDERTDLSAIWNMVEMVNVMTYDLMDRRDNVTKHHTSVADSLNAMKKYNEVFKLEYSKMNLGFAFYAKSFKVKDAKTCESAPKYLGCEIEVAELANGTDAGTSTAVTFGESSYKPANGIEFADIATKSFQKAMSNGGTADMEQGGQTYLDMDTSMFWTWDTVEWIEKKFDTIVNELGLGGTACWSLLEDAYDWNLVSAVVSGASSSYLTADSVYPTAVNGSVTATAALATGTALTENCKGKREVWTA